ncbi:2-phosphosulfolactate phosphatase [Priestia koreensis]|uniref:2-phosphosulfolactate phosphatase n=1 Tax=Priestia koreensis TaxID=284581 RepID=UPI0028F6F086|nr:2-phosphosulfolactate phosphatase [Priestia koreensis]
MKIHVLLKKEEINPIMTEGKVVVVLDILLATSTITAALAEGATYVIPVLNEREAKETFVSYPNALLVGEYEGKTIEGFLDPNPTLLKKKVSGKGIILSTTNGTVAVRKSRHAKCVYVASLLNGEEVAKKIAMLHSEDTILVVCSGSSDHFCLEDFLGAGYIVKSLNMLCESAELTDAALASLLFYEEMKEQKETILSRSRVGQMLMNYGFEKEIHEIAELNKYPIVPIFDGEKIIAAKERMK